MRGRCGPGRTAYGSGRKLAQDAQLKLTVDKRVGDRTFADYAQAGKVNFGEAAEAFISRLPANERSREAYLSAYRAHVRPGYAGKTVAQVANDRDGVLDLLTVTMKDLSISVRRKVRMIITGTCDEAVKAGKIRAHRLDGIELADNGMKHDRTDFVFPARAQVTFVADGDAGTLGAGICVWLMRGCGLRIEEALAVEKADFRENGEILRVCQQATRDGSGTVPLKKRKRGEYRDVPVPTWLWNMVRDLPDGPLMPGNGDRRYQLYTTVYNRFMNAAGKAGIPEGFTPHSLRHAFASAMLAWGVHKRGGTRGCRAECRVRGVEQAGNGEVSTGGRWSRGSPSLCRGSEAVRLSHRLVSPGTCRRAREWDDGTITHRDLLWRGGRAIGRVRAGGLPLFAHGRGSISADPLLPLASYCAQAQGPFAFATTARLGAAAGSGHRMWARPASPDAASPLPASPSGRMPGRR